LNARYMRETRHHKGKCGAYLPAWAVALCLACLFALPIPVLSEAESWTHVLLLGVDKLASDKIRSDSIMLLSVSDGGRVKLTSFMRDMVVELEGHGSQKLNRAYSYGGALLAVRTVSEYFGVAVDHYAVVNFSGLTEIVDALGGIEISITEAEMMEINKTSHEEDKLSAYGKHIRLNGHQALRFARIRTIDSDVMRASRQRQILEAIFREVKKAPSFSRIFALYQVWARHVQTDIPAPALLAIGFEILGSEEEIEQFRLPVDGTYECIFPGGILSILPDYPANAELLHAFLMRDD